MSARRYSMDDLLHRLHSDGADELKLRVGSPPVMVLDGESHPIEGPAITIEDAEQLLQSIADTRQRRELRENGVVQFIYRFRSRADFVVCARIEDENVGIDIH
jgi:Tfp pilus assembly ATPase PilU